MAVVWWQRALQQQVCTRGFEDRRQVQHRRLTPTTFDSTTLQRLTPIAANARLSRPTPGSTRTEVCIRSMLDVENTMRMRKAPVEGHYVVESEERMEHALIPKEVDVGTVLLSEEDSSDVEVSDIDVPDYHPDDHLALPLSMSKWLFRVSWLSASTCLLAVYMHLLDLALVPAAVLFTSINYWRWPDYSW